MRQSRDHTDLGYVLESSYQALSAICTMGWQFQSRVDYTLWGVTCVTWYLNAIGLKWMVDAFSWLLELGDRVSLMAWDPSIIMNSPSSLRSIQFGS